jgi:hypothetical protein
MIVNENSYNKVQVNETIEKASDGTLIKRSLMLNIRADSVEEATELYRELKKRLNSKVETPKKKAKKEEAKNPVCECGAPMVLRMNGKGEKFWGCSAFPICRKTKPYQEQSRSVNVPCDEDLIDVERIQL